MKNIKRRIGKIKNKKKWENEKLKNKIKVKKRNIRRFTRADYELFVDLQLANSLKYLICNEFVSR